jgi:hypothetical protein
MLNWKVDRDLQRKRTCRKPHFKVSLQEHNNTPQQNDLVYVFLMFVGDVMEEL